MMAKREGSPSRDDLEELGAPLATNFETAARRTIIVNNRHRAGHSRTRASKQTPQRVQEAEKG